MAADEHLVVGDGSTVATMDPARTEHVEGHVVVRLCRIESVGAGAAPDLPDAVRYDARGCLATPGLVNRHHHLYQWVTRGLAADAGLFEWLTTLYPVWAGMAGRAVAEQDRLVWLDEDELARTALRARDSLLARARR